MNYLLMRMMSRSFKYLVLIQRKYIVLNAQLKMKSFILYVHKVRLKHVLN